MSTNAPSSPISCATTAELRSLGSELNGWLSGIGLTQTSDTGQINWSTVNLPAANTVIGYEIWAFPDLSIYFRIDWKTQTTVATQPPNMLLTVGTGSNGSGTITGQTTTALSVIPTGSSIVNHTANYASYLCLNNDVFWIVWKSLSLPGSSPAMAFCIEKCVDSTGAVSGLGYTVSSINNTGAFTNVQSVRTASTATTFAVGTNFCGVPGGLTNSSNNAGQKQIFLHQYAIPDVILSNSKATIVVVEATLGTTLTTTLVGTTPQIMISMGNQFGEANCIIASSAWGTALRWQ